MENTKNIEDKVLIELYKKCEDFIEYLEAERESLIEENSNEE